MKPISAFILALALVAASVMTASAQGAESIWLTANTTAYKTGETVIVTLNAISATAIQGFTFQIRYDAACLKSVNATSLIPGMNGLSLPQTSGLMDASYAGSTPATANGPVAEIRFLALKGCQTNLTLESAALAIRNEAGFAAPLTGVAIGAKEVALNIDNAVGVAQPTLPASAATLPLDAPPSSPDLGIWGWLLGILGLGAVSAGLFAVFKLLQTNETTAAPQKPSGGQNQNASLHVKRGPYAGTSFVLDKFPCHIGRDPVNEICLDDPNISSRHARIFAANNAYYLADLGEGTFINGRLVKKSSTMLKPGDVLRLGKSALLVFGT